MPVGIPVTRQVGFARELLKQTQAGKVRWEITEDPEIFRSVRTVAVAVLDRTGNPPRVRLRFSILGNMYNDVVIEQAGPIHMQSGQRTLDKLLAVLWHGVTDATHHITAADLFLHGD
jgi:hypothetical protein